MRAGPTPIHAALLVPLALPLALPFALPLASLAASPARAQPGPQPGGSQPGRHHPPAATDMDRTLARRAEAARRDGLSRQDPRPIPRALPPQALPPALSPALPPATRERVAAPPFTGWGYGGTIPGAWPGF